MNIRNIQSHEFERKLFLAPFTLVNDDRFDWLQNVFLKYFEDWLTSIEQRPGNFSRNACSNMFISCQTFEGLKITVHLIIQTVKFLLQHHVKCILTEGFCQDPLENYFGQQRPIGTRKDNPSIRDFRFNDNSIRNQKILRPIVANNVCGQNTGMVDFTNEALPCRKKPKNRLNQIIMSLC